MAVNHFAEDVKQYFEEQKNELGIKQHLALEAVRIAGECINQVSKDDPGAQQEFLPLEGIFELSGRPLGQILEEGFAFSLAATEDGSHWIQIRICTQDEDLSNVGMVANMVRFDEFGRPEMYIDGSWYHRFSYHEGQLDPVICDKCPDRNSCLHYQEMMEEEEAFNEWLESEDGKIQVLLHSLPEWGQELVSEPETAAGAMFASYLTYLEERDLPFDEEDWKKASEHTSLLCELCDKAKTLDFSFNGKNFNLISSDENHHGFLIRQNDDELELCQCIDLHLLGAALDVEWWNESYDPYWINPVGTGTVKQMLTFERRHLMRSSEEATLYTIPLSLEKCVYLYGRIGKHFPRVRKAAARYAAKCSDAEMRKEKEWDAAMEKELEIARRNIV